ALIEELRTFRDRTQQENARQLEDARRRTADQGSMSTFNGIEDLADFRFVTEKLLGIDTSNWTMALEKNTFNFSSPLSSDLLFQTLLQIGASTDSTLGELAAANASPEDRKFCNYLQSRTATTVPVPGGAPRASDTPQGTASASAAEEPRLIERCAR